MKKILVNSHSIGLDIGVLFCSWVNFVHSGPFTFDFTLQQQQFLSRLISSPLTPFVYIYLNIYICLYTYIFCVLRLYRAGPEVINNTALSWPVTSMPDSDSWLSGVKLDFELEICCCHCLFLLLIFFYLGTTIYHGTLKYFSHRLRCSCSVCKHLIREFLRTILRA